MWKCTGFSENQGNRFITSSLNRVNKFGIFIYWEDDLKVCDDGTLVQILRSWTLSIVLSESESRAVSLSKHNVSEIGFSLRLQVRPTQLGSIDRASPHLRTWIYSSSILVL
jgi:hypothetical protein